MSYPSSSRMYLYLLTMTDEGSNQPMGFEVNSTMVVRAANAQHARSLASGVTIDEPEYIWLNKRFSACCRIGEVTAGANRKPGVICQENNAS